MQPTRIYSDDLSYYQGRMESLVEEAAAGFSHAVARMRDHVPRLSQMANHDIPDAELSIEDAKCVYAREHGFENWDAFTEFIAEVGAGSRDEPFVAFIHAVEAGDKDVVEGHLDGNPNLVQHIASTHKSALHSSPDADLTMMLISRGAPVELETPLPGGTSLVHALIWGRTEKAEALATVSLKPGNLRVAAGLGRLEMLETMWTEDGELTLDARKDRAYYRPNYGWFAWEPSDEEQEVLDEALVYAATNGQIGSAQYLVDRGADVNGLAYETPPLLRAAWRGHTEMVDWLLDHGASIDARGWLGGHVKGGTALHLAAINGNTDLAKHLLSRDADPTVRDELYDGVPDGWANHFNHSELGNYLLSIRESYGESK